jgi:hypothetical protein
LAALPETREFIEAIESGSLVAFSQSRVIEYGLNEVVDGTIENQNSLANMEHHHFKFEGHRRPGDLHVHFFGADAFSFGEGVMLQPGDVMQVSFPGFGRPLRNSLARVPPSSKPVEVKPI